MINNYNSINSISSNNSNNNIKTFFTNIYYSIKKCLNSNSYSNNRELGDKFSEAFNEYKMKYSERINFHIKEPYNEKFGLINLLNDCYIISFLQILFHTPHFLETLKKLDISKNENIVKYLLLVSEYPFNAEHFLKLKQLLGIINPEYSKAYSNDSQEFGIDLINYLISETNKSFEESYEIMSDFRDEDINVIKKNAFNQFNNIRKELTGLEELFLFNQVDIYCKVNGRKAQISSNLYIELTLQKTNSDLVVIEDLLNDKYNMNNSELKPNQIIIKSKLISLPKILIISINRVLNNEKINNIQIEFEEILELQKNKHIDCDLFDDKNKKTTYHLYAINECIHSRGFNRYYSHYICYIKIKNEWFQFDDSKIPEKKNLKGKMKSGSVVGLFYIREL